MSKNRRIKKKKIGITISGRALILLWTNGLNQNIHSFYTVVEKSLKYDPCLLVHCKRGSKEEENIKHFKTKNPEIKITLFNDVISGKEKLDLIVESGQSYDGVLIEKIKAEHPKTKFVTLSYGNAYFLLSEKLVNSKEGGASAAYDHPRDAVWASPHFKETFEWLQISKQAPFIREAPYVWTPKFLLQSMESIGVTKEDFKPSSKMNIGVIEPNINLIKNCMIPIAIIEHLYNKNTETMGDCMIFNAADIRKHAMADSLFLHLNSVKGKKTTFEGRYKFAKIFSSYADIMLSHQHMCGLNYTYLESFYLGIPLVHNSKYFKDAGYYYEEFSISGGSRALEAAILDKGNFSNHHKLAANEYLWKYSLENQENIDKYIELIDEVIEG